MGMGMVKPIVLSSKVYAGLLLGDNIIVVSIIPALARIPIGYLLESPLSPS